MARVTLAACSIIVAIVPYARSARADETDDCATAAERAQALRASHHLREASDALRECARSTCPKLVRTDCEGWQREVGGLLPTVIFRAIESRGRDVVAVSVTVDGREAQRSLDGAAVPLDPGPHHVRFEARAGAVYEEEVLVAESQKARIVTARFLEPLRADGVHEVEATRPVPIATWVSLGVAGVALTVLTALEIVAQNDYAGLRGGCGRTQTCDPAAVDATRTKFRAAGVSLGVAAVALGIAGFTFFTRPEGAVGVSF